MERNCKLKVKVSQDAIDRLGIDENSMLETVFKDGVITIRVLSDAEVQEVMHEAEPHEEEYDSMEDAYADGLDDGHVDGYEAGYRTGFNHCLEGKPYDSDYPGDYVLSDDSDCNEDDCEDCEYFCHRCEKCVLDE